MFSTISNIASLNINGLNDKSKQFQLINYMKYNRISILLIQEHNIRNLDAICSELNDFCEIVINLAIAHKGGTAVLIDRRIAFKIFNIEKSANSRIISLKISVYENVIQLINVYAHANSTKDREELFNDELTYYMRNNFENTIVAGDWNCVLSQRDTRSINSHISKALLNIIRTLKFKDIWFNSNNAIEYTYVKGNYGSRIDRIYAKDSLANFIDHVNIIHTNMSDHSCVRFNLNLPNIPKPGKYYWKLNVSLLKIPNVINKFADIWGSLTHFIDNFSNINEWWESFAKKEIKKFFIERGKVESRKKYDTLNYLEYSLNRLYNKLNITGELDFQQVKYLKDRINNIKNEILEGVKVRSRVEEQLKGEQVSTFLIKKQSNVKAKQFMTSVKTEPNILENLDGGTILTNKDSIELYVQKYYQKLYKEEPLDINEQEFFLNHIQNLLDDDNIELLSKDVTQAEIYNAIRNMSLNKSPGLDGLPTEFYLCCWNIIKSEVTQIVKNNINGQLLGDFQKKAIITLIPKDGDLSLLGSWRPISLLCCDVKIISKILAMRLQPLMKKIISPYQYCVKDRSINECTCKIRDVMYYCGKENLTGAAINLDWEKAFDRVNWKLLFKVMSKMGFPNFIINWVVILFKGIESSCLINGNVSLPFSVERGVRQGCPLSMLLYVIFQEPLYRAFQVLKVILPPLTIEKQKCVGYADDTTIFIRNLKSIHEIFRILKKFEKASNSKINIGKTKIYGFGEWKGKVDWPIPGIKVELNYFKTLGIFFSCDYEVALDVTWQQLVNKIKRRIPLIKNRGFTIYQKVIIVNALLASKIWYISHVYPLPITFSKQIESEFLNFIWKVNYRPIKRDILYNPKTSGGLGLINIEAKSKSIFVATVIKLFINAKENSLIKYFMALRINALFDIRYIPRLVSHVNAPFYEYAVDCIRMCFHMQNFPKINANCIYRKILPVTQPETEKLYPLFNWNQIWPNVCFKYINIWNRQIVFKFLHDILPNKKKLNEWYKSDPNCTDCMVEENNMHMVLYCCKTQRCKIVLFRTIFYLCHIDIEKDIIKTLFFDFPKINKKVTNTLCIVISIYIANIWYNRDNMENLEYKFKSKIKNSQKLHMEILKDKSKNVFTDNYVNINRRIIDHL